MPVIDESNIENIESREEQVEVPVLENTLEISTKWFDEHAKQIQIRREPILATFAQVPQELVEEIYESVTLPVNIPYQENSYGNLQPIADIITETLENEDDYSEQIMVETFEFNGNTYWIDAENRILHNETFEHIGQYNDTDATIVYY